VFPAVRKPVWKGVHIREGFNAFEYDSYMVTAVEILKDV